MEVAIADFMRRCALTFVKHTEVRAAVTRRCNELVPELTLAGLTQHAKVLARFNARGLLALDRRVVETAFLRALNARFGEPSRSSGCTLETLRATAALHKEFNDAGLLPSPKTGVAEIENPIVAWFTSHTLLALQRLGRATVPRAPLVSEPITARCRETAFRPSSARGRANVIAPMCVSPSIIAELTAVSELQASGLVQTEQVEPTLLLVRDAVERAMIARDAVRPASAHRK